MAALPPGDERREFPDSLQRALKLLANSTSYGALVETNPETDSHEAHPVLVYASRAHRIRTHRIERPGPFFAGPIGALIPAGGRLLLALAERLAADRGLGYVFCDTDSMAFARPQSMAREDFESRVDDVVGWFTALSPYASPGALLQREAVNDWNGHPESLYCFAVSAKRYVLYNRLEDGTFRIRKFSAHGTGDLVSEPTVVSTTLEPCQSVFSLGGPRWKYDLWYSAIEQAERGCSRIDVTLPALEIPVLNKVTITTWHLYQQHRGIPGLRPFSFVTILPALSEAELLVRRNCHPVGARGESNPYDSLRGISYYAPYGRAFEDICGSIRRADSHELVQIEHRTLNERLAGYFRHPELKSSPADGVGRLERRHVFVAEQVFIGKESNQVRDEIAEQSSGAVPGEQAHPYVADGLYQCLRCSKLTELSRVSGVPKSTISTIISSQSNPSQRIRTLLLTGLRALLGLGAPANGNSTHRQAPRISDIPSAALLGKDAKPVKGVPAEITSRG